MPARNLKLERFIDADAVRLALSELTRESDGDGSSPAIRTEVLKALKSASSDGRKLAEDMLNEDGDGTACARRLSFLQDEIIRIIYDFAVTGDIIRCVKYNSHTIMPYMLCFAENQ